MKPDIEPSDDELMQDDLDRPAPYDLGCEL